jgi:hypothetical protein
MDPRTDFIPFKPVEEWYEGAWLRPKPAKQSMGSRLPSGVRAYFRLATTAVFRWLTSVHYRDEAAPGSETFPP